MELGGRGRAPGRANRPNWTAGWGRIVFQSATLDSSQEATGLVRESFPEAALALGYGPNVCNIWSAQATNAVKTPHVPGLNSVFMSPQVPCRLRVVRSRTKASTSVWRPTLQAHATRPLPTCMCEVRTQAVPGPVPTEPSCPSGMLPRARGVDTRGAATGPVSLFLPASFAAAMTAAAPTGQAPNVRHYSTFLPCRPFGKQPLLGALVSLVGLAARAQSPMGV